MVSFVGSATSATRILLLVSLLVAHIPHTNGSPWQTKTQTNNSRLTVTARRIVLVRPASVVKLFPQRRTAVVTYPIVSGLADPLALKRTREILQIKNVFDYSLNDYRQDQWLTEFNYRINYNKNYIFDITFTQSGLAAYPDTQTKHFAIDLRRGAVIKASDVFLSGSLTSLAALVNEKFQTELTQVRAKIRAASDLDSAEAKSILEAFDDMKFEVSNLDDFSVGANGLTFLYDVGFPHAIEVFEPRGQYFIPYTELKTYIKAEGILAQFAR